MRTAPGANVSLTCLPDDPTESGQRGFVHSTETCGGADGPGLRYIVYLQGCPLRCLYCHNPDTRATRTGRERTVEEVVAEAVRYRSYLAAAGGGVTISGGEPLLQPKFTFRLLERLHAAGLHTALDTSGHASLLVSRPALEAADLVLLDLKSSDEATHRRIAGVGTSWIYATAEYLAYLRKPTWVRFVLVPGLTDDPANVQGVAQFARQLGNVQRVDVLPFHKLGEHKWRRLKLDYELHDTPTPTPQQLAAAIATFRAAGLDAH